MMVGRIAGATRNLGAPPGWERDKHGACGGLPIRDEMHSPGLPRMVSAWIPTPGELAALQAGAPIYLHVIGATHPPVWVGVGLPPAEQAPSGQPPLDPKPAGASA